MSKTTLTSKGQVTIPIEIRRALGLRRGDTLTVELRADGALFRKVGTAHDLIVTVAPRTISWKEARRTAWQARGKRLARSSATRTSSSGS